jgi:hypothetical protein
MITLVTIASFMQNYWIFEVFEITEIDHSLILVFFKTLEKMVFFTSFHCIVSSSYACCHLKTLPVKHGSNVKLWKLWVNSDSSHGDICHLKNQNLY